MSVAWPDLAGVALVGTARRPPAPPASTGDPLDALLAGLPWQDAEQAVLDAAAALALARNAAAAPPRADAAPAAAPPETLPVCSPAAAALLDRLTGLDTEFGDLLGAWLARAARARLRAPADRLPVLLDAAAADPDLAPGVQAAGGARVAWLAAQNPRWRSAVAAGSVEELWETGAPEERRELLARLRRRDPARALALLRSTWASEAASDRAQFVAALATGVGPGDEPFLEAALDDRRKPVRQAAARVLAALPQSAFAERMAARLRPLMTRARRRVELELPDDPDASALRDGLELAPRRRESGRGARAQLLVDLVAATPLWAWDADEPRKLVEQLMRAEHAFAIFEGLARAARTQRDGAWGAALAVRTGDLGLLAHATPEATAAVLPGLLRGEPFEWLMALEALPGPWSAPASRVVVDKLRAEARELADGFGVDGFLRPLGTRLEPALRDAVEAALEPVREHGGPSAAAGVQRLVDRLDLRLAIDLELPCPP